MYIFRSKALRAGSLRFRSMCMYLCIRGRVHVCVSVCVQMYICRYRALRRDNERMYVSAYASVVWVGEKLHICRYTFADIELFPRYLEYVCQCVRGTVSTKIVTLAKPTKWRNSDFLTVSRGTNSNWEFALTSICAEEFGFLDLVGFGGLLFSVESVAYH